jgi:UDP-N-acetylmuramate--alanine ligase
VAEACEYDRSFHHLRPERAAILNIEEDHLDYYSGLDEIVESFTQFARGVSPNGLIVASGEDAAVGRAVRSARAAVETFGLSGSCSWQAAGLTHDAGRYRFRICYEGRPFLDAVLGHLAGRHQVCNALAATALAWSAGVDKDAILHGLATFRGAYRRMTVRGEGRGIAVLDDYGHHPTEIKTTLRALRERYAGRRLWLVFQPHQHSRTRFLLDDFARSFGGADHVIVPDIYFVRDSEADRLAVSSRDLVDRIRGGGGDALYLPSPDAILGYLLSELREGDVVVTMGAGDVWKIADELVRRLQ